MKQPKLKWIDLIENLAIEYCQLKGIADFHVNDFFHYYDENTLALFAPDNKHRHAKVRQTFQFLRKEKRIEFLDNKGHYRLSEFDTVQSTPQIVIADQKLTEEPMEREYLVEVRARNKGLAKVAREVYGYSCLIEKCSNTFEKEDGTPYIEVHHMEFLCQGGKNNLKNLSVVCAHHHRAAHFAKPTVRQEIFQELQYRTETILNNIQINP